MTSKHTPGACIQALPCGCAVTGDGTIPEPFTVALCPQHAAAPELYEALQDIIAIGRVAADPLAARCVKYARAALAKADREVTS